MSIKYILCPGEVRSEDRDIHFIDAPTLARLYGVKLSECIIRDYRNPKTLQGYDSTYLNSLIWLSPKLKGNYKLPNALLL